MKNTTAVSTPTFPSCASPQGDLKVSYSEGTHGIVGSGASYSGQDAVYTLSDSTLTQCFCSVDGVGIQTNWWVASSLSEDEVNVLKSEGWTYVPTGNLWGLTADPYLAKNLSYSCLPSTTSTSSSSNTSTSNNSTSESNGIGGGDVLGASTGDVLGLAATGDSLLVYATFLLSILFLFFGIRRLKHSN